MADSAKIPAGRAALLEAVRRSSARAVARRVGVDESSLREWMSGESTPTPPNVKKLRAAGVKGAWRTTRRVEPPAPSPPPSVPEIVDDGPLDPRAEQERTVRQLRAMMTKLETDPGATAKERAAVSSSLVRATRELSRMSGSDITIPQILRSHEWKRLEVFIVEALRAVPGAREALAAGLRTLEAP